MRDQTLKVYVLNSHVRLVKELWTILINFTKNTTSKEKYICNFLLATFVLDKYPSILATFVYLS